MLKAALIVAGVWAAICFIVFPLLRYLIVRGIFYLRCLFSKAKLSSVGFLSFIVPHFWNGKPDYFMLSGNKLYAIKLKSYRKTKTKITITSDKKWQIESIRSAQQATVSVLHAITEFGHKIMVHKRFYKAPTSLVKYAKNINRALANEDIDCVPVVIINPSIKTIMTADNIELVDGDTIFYGIQLFNSFFPKNASKPAVSSKEAARIIGLAKQQLKLKIN
jgi:hypothetical protein